jgi:hypothetical protein
MKRESNSTCDCSRGLLLSSFSVCLSAYAFFAVWISAYDMAMSRRALAYDHSATLSLRVSARKSRDEQVHFFLWLIAPFRSPNASTDLD